MSDALGMIVIVVLLLGLFVAWCVLAPNIAIRRLVQRAHPWGTVPLAPPVVDQAYRGIPTRLGPEARLPPLLVRDAAGSCFILLNGSLLAFLAYGGGLAITFANPEASRCAFAVCATGIVLTAWLAVERIATGVALARRSPHVRRIARRMTVAALLNHGLLAGVGLWLACDSGGRQSEFLMFALVSLSVGLASLHMQWSAVRVVADASLTSGPAATG